MTTRSQRAIWEAANPAEGFLTSLDWVNIAMAGKFTTRELEVAILLFEGRSRARIARKLKLSAQTVRVYVDRLYRKTRVKTNVGFVLRVVRLHPALKEDSRARHTKM